MILLEGSFISIVGNQLELIYFCGELDFVHMYDLCRWKFLHKIHQNFSYGVTLLKHIDIGTDYFECVYNCHSTNASCMRFAVISKLQRRVIDNRPRLLCMFVFLLPCCSFSVFVTNKDYYNILKFHSVQNSLAMYIHNLLVGLKAICRGVQTASQWFDMLSTCPSSPVSVSFARYRFIQPYLQD